VQHLPAPEAAAHFAANAQACAHRQCFLLRGVEAEEAQRAFARRVLHLHHKLAARAQLHLARGHGGLDLRQLAVARAGDRHDARFVLVAQRQVQRQVDVARQPQLAQGLLDGGGECARRGHGVGAAPGCRKRKHRLHRGAGNRAQATP